MINARHSKMDKKEMSKKRGQIRAKAMHETV
jgi:hypothetical protein